MRRLLFGIVAFVCVAVGTLSVLLVDEGDVGLKAVFSYMASPVVIPIIAEFLALPFLIISFFIPKDMGRARCLLRFTALGLVIGLVDFYFIIPRIPIDIEPNHPDPRWDEGEVVHILPAVNTDRILLKTSFVRRVEQPAVEYTVRTPLSAPQEVPPQTRTWFGFGQIPLRLRQKFLNHALQFEPDIMGSSMMNFPYWVHKTNRC